MTGFLLFLRAGGWKLVVGVLLLAASFTYGYHAGSERAYKRGYVQGVKDEDERFAVQLEAQRKTAKKLYDDAVSNNNHLKADYDALKRKWQIDHDANEKASQALNKRIAALTRDGRLRDPNARSCSGSPSASGKADTGLGSDLQATPGELLSQPLTELLLSIAADADRVLAVANECSTALKGTQ